MLLQSKKIQIHYRNNLWCYPQGVKDLTGDSVSSPPFQFIQQRKDEQELIWRTRLPLYSKEQVSPKEQLWGWGTPSTWIWRFVLEISLQGSDECNLSREGARGLACGHSSSMAEQVKEWTLLLKFHHLPSPFLPLERKISALLFAVAVPEKIISGFFSILGDGISGHPDMISLFWCWCGASWPQLQLLQIMSWR